MADNALKATDGKCPEGYTAVWIWCLKKTAVNKLSEPLNDIEMPEFTDVSCEAAISAMKSINKSLQAALEAPRKYMNLMKQLVSYPFDVASQMVAGALSAIDQVNKALSDLMSGTSDLENALRNILSCPLLADTAVGKLAAQILDAMSAGDDIRNLLNQFKNQISSAANDFLNNLKSTPLDAINNMRKAYDNLLERAGINDLVKLLKQLEQCVEQLCAAYSNMESFLKRMPTSSDDLLKAAGSAYDATVGKVKQIGLTTAANTVSPLVKAADTVTGLVRLQT